MTHRTKLAAGNWKMHGDGTSLSQIDALRDRHPEPGCEVLVCPPATLLSRMAERVRGGSIMVGGQDCHHAETGAHTGDISAAMLKEAGASHVILGHSERRADHGESSDQVRAKAAAAYAAGLSVIICVGESLNQREAGRTLDVVGAQLRASTPDGASGADTVIAYEPVWAIGTGKVPSLGQIGEVHSFLRQQLATRFGEKTAAGVRLLYGGSVTAGNAAEIFSVGDVDGALVGGASLKSADFSPIMAALEAAG